jgi:hypothetical protein
VGFNYFDKSDKLLIEPALSSSSIRAICFKPEGNLKKKTQTSIKTISLVTSVFNAIFLLQPASKALDRIQKKKQIEYGTRFHKIRWYHGFNQGFIITFNKNVLGS